MSTTLTDTPIARRTPSSITTSILLPALHYFKCFRCSTLRFNTQKTVAIIFKKKINKRTCLKYLLITTTLNDQAPQYHIRQKSVFSYMCKISNKKGGRDKRHSKPNSREKKFNFHENWDRAILYTHQISTNLRQSSISIITIKNLLKIHGSCPKHFSKNHPRSPFICLK